VNEFVQQKLHVFLYFKRKNNKEKFPNKQYYVHDSFISGSITSMSNDA